MSLREYAKYELEHAGLFSADSDYGGLLGQAVMRLIDVFAGEGHSGMSAGLAVSIFEKLARYEPLTPLTGEPDEWNEIERGRYQNRRCCHVFKNGDEVYDSQGRIFRYPDGGCFISAGSRVPVTFPYTPKREYIDVEEGA